MKLRLEKNMPTVYKIRHSLAHLLAMAVLRKFPKAKLGIGPAIENGFYYDFKLPAPFTDADLPEIEKIMRELIAGHLEFRGEKITTGRAKKMFKDQPFKLELIKNFTKEKKPLTIFSTCSQREKEKTGTKSLKPKTKSCFTDLCKGGHIQSTSEINPDAFKLTHIAGAYWKGNEKNPMLTRIYGVAFKTKEELEKHLAQIEEAKKRDHKELGPELDLFTFSEAVGPGLPLWTPKGTILRNILDDFVWRLRKEKGYERVDIPHLAKKDLYEKSGHWDKFKDELFKIQTREGHIFVLKPMNCPHHTQIYRRKQWSWRDLPQRYASTTKVYRDEQTGEIGGLARVRSITQDDAHVFCRYSQVKEEILKIWDMINSFYGAAGFDLKIRLSLRDRKNTKKYLGTPRMWKKTEAILRQIAKEKKAAATEAAGEAAFYGPKIDFLAKDSLGREWQVATIQLDMNMPERFDLFCINEKGEKERIVMIHAAIMGAIERFISILIEHYAGAFPLWLAPVQIRIISINDEVRDYAEPVKEKCEEKNIRAESDTRNETVGRKIREAELQKIPYLLIIGTKEKESKTVAVRERGKGDIGEMPLEKFFEKIKNGLNPPA